MRVYGAGVDAALAKEGIVAVTMILFDFPSGYWGYWMGIGNFVWNSITWRGAGSLIELQFAGEGTDLASRPLTARLRAVADTTLDADTLATIESESYSQRPVTLYTAYFDRDTRVLISVEQEWAGIVDTFDHVEDGGDHVLVGHFESRSIDYTRRGAAIRSNGQQNLISAGDLFFDFVATVAEKDIYFGRKQPASSGSRYSGSPV
jgi:hypothetical protein